MKSIFNLQGFDIIRCKHRLNAKDRPPPRPFFNIHSCHYYWQRLIIMRHAYIYIENRWVWSLRLSFLLMFEKIIFILWHHHHNHRCSSRDSQVCEENFIFCFIALWLGFICVYVRVTNTHPIEIVMSMYPCQVETFACILRSIVMWTVSHILPEEKDEEEMVRTTFELNRWRQSI